MKKHAQAGPSLFDAEPEDETGPGAGEVASRAVDATASSPGPVAPVRRAWRGEPGFVFHMSPAEKAASEVDIPVRSRWTFEGREVEVRGTSPLMVWFTEPGAPPLTQATRYRHEFLKKAARL